jgi:hypothetical protein
MTPTDRTVIGRDIGDALLSFYGRLRRADGSMC